MSSNQINSITLIKYQEATIMIKNVPLKLIMRINYTKKIFMRLCTNVLMIIYIAMKIYLVLEKMIEN